MLHERAYFSPTFFAFHSQSRVKRVRVKNKKFLTFFLLFSQIFRIMWFETCWEELGQNNIFKTKRSLEEIDFKIFDLGTTRKMKSL